MKIVIVAEDDIIIGTIDIVGYNLNLPMARDSLIAEIKDAIDEYSLVLEEDFDHEDPQTKAQYIIVLNGIFQVQDVVDSEEELAKWNREKDTYTLDTLERLHTEYTGMPLGM